MQSGRRREHVQYVTSENLIPAAPYSRREWMNEWMKDFV